MSVSSSTNDQQEINNEYEEQIRDCKETECGAEKECGNDSEDNCENDIILSKKKLKSSRIIDSESSDADNNENADCDDSDDNKLSITNDSVSSEEESTKDVSKILLESPKKTGIAESDEESIELVQKSGLKNHEDILRKYAESESSDNESINEDKNEDRSGNEDSDNKEERVASSCNRPQKIQRRSAKQAQENMLLMQSETQKLYREAEISVPYHRPRQCTLKEFLGRKTIQWSKATEGKRNKANIHMRGEELLRYAKHLEERAKEAELFFKTNIDKNPHENEQISIAKEADMDLTTNMDLPTNIINEDKEFSLESNSNSDIAQKCVILQNEENSNIDQVTELSMKTSETDQIIQPLTEENNVVDEILNDLNIEVSKEPVTDMEIDLNSSKYINKQIYDLDPIQSTSKQSDDAEFINKKLANENEEVFKKDSSALSTIKKNALDKNAFQKLSDSEDDDIILKDTEVINKLDNPTGLFKSTPTLSGCPGMVIDLEENRVVSHGVGQLMQRFVKHAKVKPAPRKHIIRSEPENKADGVLTVNPDEMEAGTTNLIPGLALQKLRHELQARMAQRRSEEFSKRLKQQEKEKEGYEEDILDDKFEENEDEFELEISSSEEEAEIEENKTSLPVEENLVEDQACDVDENEENDEELEDFENNEESVADDEDSDESEDENSHKVQSKKIRRRLQTMDSSDSESETEKENVIKRESLDLFQTQNEDELIPLHQTKLAEPHTTPQNKTSSSLKDSELKLSSPTMLTEGTPLTPGNLSVTKSNDVIEEKNQPNALAVKRLFTESFEPSQKDELFVSTQDDIISSKFAEDELLELCSGKFPTQQVMTQATQNNINESETPQDSMKLLLSDDDSLQDALNIIENKKHKKKKKHATIKPLQFSDDESEKENEFEYEDGYENIEDNNEDAEKEDCEDVEKLYEYDSEENEIEVTSDKIKEAKTIKHQARDFLENEAELSESEWGSADEDERGLDTYDCELGDEDVIDTKKVRGELERIHIRQVLDEDKREVRLLQELLLEDGENHGDATRERKFKWKNAGDGFNLDQHIDDQEAEGVISEDEDQTEWRKNRFEREKVLREKQMQLDEITDTSVLLTDTLVSDSFSEKKTNLVIKKKAPQQIVMFEKEESFLAVGSIKKLYRGSFLKRDEATLSRLSALTKTNVENPENSAGLGSTGKGNFVFSTISPAQQKLPAEEKSKKRGPAEDLSNVNKKVKKSMANKKLLLDYLE